MIVIKRTVFMTKVYLHNGMIKMHSVDMSAHSAFLFEHHAAERAAKCWLFLTFVLYIRLQY